MAWSPIAKPYEKYIYEDPNDYTAVDPDLIKGALDQAGLGDASSGILTNFNNMMGTVPGFGPTPTKATAGNNSPGVSYRDLIENDPYYKQALAEQAAGGISDAAQRAAALKKAVIDWGVIPDWATEADKLGLDATTLSYLNTDIDPTARQYAAQNEAQGLSRHARLASANDQNIKAIRDQLAARGMYQSGELGYGLEDNARQYKQASSDALAQVLGQIQDISGRFGASQAARAHDVATARSDAAERALAITGSSNPTATNAVAANTPGAKSSFVLPAKTAMVWDVNTASTYDAINAAKQSGGGITIRPDDPESLTKANAASQAGVPVSIQVNGVGDDTPQSLAARVAQYQAQFPGASFTLDLESPNFRGGPGSPGGDQMAQYAAQVQAVAGNTPIIITTEGVSDFNYGAWKDNPNVIFAPQAYWGDMTPRNVSQVVALLTSQGIPIDRIIPVVAPGQDLGDWTGPVSVYGAPAGQSLQTNEPQPQTQAAPASTPLGAAQQNAVQSAPNYSPETIAAINAAVQQAYENPYMDEVYRPGGMY